MGFREEEGRGCGRHRAGGRGRRARWLLLGTAVAQAVSPLVAGFEQGSGADPVVVPPGPFFAVWGVVVLGSVAAALWGLPLSRATRAPWTAVQVSVSVAQTGFVVWLLAAATAPALTLPVFLVMLGVLTWSLRTVLRTPCGRPTRVLLGGTLGVYTGWSAAAVWSNGATLLPGDATVAWALLVTGAALTACAGARLFGGQLAFTLAAGWALLGVVVSTSGAGEPGLAAAGLAAVAVTALASRTSAVPASAARARVLSRSGRKASR